MMPDRCTLRRPGVATRLTLASSSKSRPPPAFLRRSASLAWAKSIILPVTSGSLAAGFESSGMEHGVFPPQILGVAA
jgi:hypothetical protein